jgi:hypothetical protein
MSVENATQRIRIGLYRPVIVGSNNGIGLIYLKSHGSEY